MENSFKLFLPDELLPTALFSNFLTKLFQRCNNGVPFPCSIDRILILQLLAAAVDNVDLRNQITGPIVQILQNINENVAWYWVENIDNGFLKAFVLCLVRCDVSTHNHVFTTHLVSSLTYLNSHYLKERVSCNNSTTKQDSALLLELNILIGNILNAVAHCDNFDWTPHRSSLLNVIKESIRLDTFLIWLQHLFLFDCVACISH